MNEQPPDLSVVVPSVNGWQDLEGALRALRGQQGGVRLEILVVDRVGPAVRDPLVHAFPDCTLIAVSSDCTIPRMRELAFERASADVVGVIEDHVLVPPDWALRMLASHREGAQVVGGAVANAATMRVVDWAAFLCEYSHCLAPASEGPATWLTGNNVTYRRDLLERFAATLRRGYWEDALHDAIRDAGVALTCRPDIVVGHKRHYSAWEYTRQRYLYSRAYAAMRLERAGSTHRLARGVAALALPPLVLWRIVRNVVRSGRHRMQLSLSLPLLVLFASAWGWGEAVGYWRGDGGALARVN